MPSCWSQTSTMALSTSTNITVTRRSEPSPDWSCRRWWSWSIGSGSGSDAHVQLLLDLQQLHLEYQRGVGGDRSPGAFVAISNGRGADQLGLTTHLHFLESFGPAFDHLTQGEFGRLPAPIGAVELRAVGEGAAVVHFDFVAGRGVGTAPFLL